MKAMVLTKPGAPFELLNLPDPTPQPGEAVAQVLACGAGLTVQHIRAGRSRVSYPRIVGHEIAAEIVAIGHEVEDLRIGDAVTAYYYLTCGACVWCKKGRETLCDNLAGQVGKHIDGGYAEFIKLPATSFIRLPEALDYRSHPAEIGVIADAVATPVKIVKKTRLQPGETVAVIGAGGGLGLHMVKVASNAGVRVIGVDIRTEKTAACIDAGAQSVVGTSGAELTESLRAETNNEGVDVVVDFVASPQTLEAAVTALRKGGRLAILGGGGSTELFKASGDFIKGREIEILGSKYASRAEVRAALKLVARGDFWPIVTETHPLTDAESLHVRIEAGLVTGRAALLMQEVSRRRPIR